MAEETLETRAQTLFERNPLVGALSIVVAGNALPGARSVDVDGKAIMLPDWDTVEWGWWLKLCIDMARAMEDEKPEGTKDDPELNKAREAATRLITSEGTLRLEGSHLEGDDEIGWLAIAGRILMTGGRLLARQGKRAAKWAAPYAKRAASKAWNAARSAFRTAPLKVTAGVALLVAPETSLKVVKAAAKMAGKLFGGAVSALASELGPIGLLAIAGILYYVFRGKGAAED